MIKSLIFALLLGGKLMGREGKEEAEMWQQPDLLGEGQVGRTHAPWETLRAGAGPSFSHPQAVCRERPSGGHGPGKQPLRQLGTCGCTAG